VVRKEERVQLTVEGPGVTPETVDSLQLLQLAEGALRLAVKVAETAKVSFTFRGLQVHRGSVAVLVTPSDARAAKFGMARALRVVEGLEDAPEGAEILVGHLRQHLRHLPPSQSAKFVAGAWSGRLTVPAAPASDQPWERIGLRVRPIRVGGAGDVPRARLVSLSERAPFIVDVAREDARKIGANLYGEIDVTLDVARDAEGLIEHGKLVEIHELSDVEPVGAWRAWFSVNAREWDRIDVVMEELGRGLD
jgi:hypothetical protein